VGEICVSSDIHLAQPFDLFTSRLPTRLRDRAARIEHLKDGDVTTFGKNHSRARYMLPSSYVYNRPGPTSWLGSDKDEDIAAGLLSLRLNSWERVRPFGLAVM
jgi:hypothetical protein